MWLNELPYNSYKPITNTAWVRARLCKWHKEYTRLAAASDNVYQLFAHGRWFSPGTPASSSTKTGRHDIAEILLKVALNTINQIKSILTAYLFRTPQLSPVPCGVRIFLSSVFCVLFCRSLFVLLSFFIWSLCCFAYRRFTTSDYLFGILDLRLLITPLLS